MENKHPKSIKAIYSLIGVVVAALVVAMAYFGLNNMNFAVMSRKEE